MQTKIRNHNCLTLLFFLCTSPLFSHEAKLQSLSVYPATIHLSSAKDYQQFLVIANYDDDTNRDVSQLAQVNLSVLEIATLTKNKIFPKANGKSKLNISYQGKKSSINIHCQNIKKKPGISFELDVMPVFMKAGCNTGSCHGSSRGKDGFHLSLFGYDPKGDYFNLTKQMSGRRLNLAIPEESLLLAKATKTASHEGGKRFSIGSNHYNTILNWIKDGATRKQKQEAHLTNIEIFPKNSVLKGKNTKQRIIVRATYSDKTNRDITDLAVYSSSNPNSAKIDQKGGITALERGEAFIMARFGAFTVGSHLIVLPKKLNYNKPQKKPEQDIDKIIAKKLHRLRILPSKGISHGLFLRRVYLDIIGTLPSLTEQENFLKDRRSNKRELLIKQLLKKPEFTNMWVMKWAELLQISSNKDLDYKPTLLYHTWLKDQISQNVPIDKIVKKLLTAKGKNFDNPEATYYLIEKEPKKIAENVAQVFMGTRIQCAQCHNHPFDRWTQNDYYGFSAFFARIGRKKSEDPREWLVFSKGSGEAKHPLSQQNMPPKFLGGKTPKIAKKDRREILADWLTAKENPFFARNLANMIWAHFLGRGIVEPVDDFRISNPPSNPELLKLLTQKLISSNYDFKKLVLDICNSEAYQRSCETNETNKLDQRNFAHAKVRRIRSEVLLDCISKATNTKDKFKGLAKGSKAVEIADGKVSNYFLKTFGRSTRETVCSCEVKTEPNLSQALHLINGNTIQSKINQGKVIDLYLKEKKPASEILNNLFLRTLCRKPIQKEADQLLKKVNRHKNSPKIWKDIFWALLNSKEFIFIN